MNDRDNVNYLIESTNDNKINYKMDMPNLRFKTSLSDFPDNISNINNVTNNKDILSNKNFNLTSNNNSPIGNIKDLVLHDRDEIYIKSTEKLLINIKNSIEHFNNYQQVTVKNSDVKEIVKMLNDELDKIKSEKEMVLIENKKLKDKIKILIKNNNNLNNNLNNNGNLNFNNNVNNINNNQVMTNNSLSKSNQNNSNTYNYIDDNSVPVNKVIESFLKLQLKYDLLEKENNYLKTENEDLNRKLTVKKKFVTEDLEIEKYSPYNKSRPSTSMRNNSNNYAYSQKKQSNEMETLIKEQLKCMQKMLYLVQDDNSNNEVELLMNKYKNK